MSTDSPAASSPSSSGGTSRRRLLVFLGASGAGLVASMFSREEARAAHDGSNVLHVGEVNLAPADAVTLLSANVADLDGLIVSNVQGSGSGVRGVSQNGPALGSGTGVIGVSGAGAGVAGFSESGPAVRGQSQFGPGVRGESDSAPGLQGFGQAQAGVAGTSQTGAGVVGTGSSGPGVSGESQSGPGVVGISDSGSGGHFQSNSGVALSVSGTAGVGGDVDAFVFGVSNEHAGEVAGGIYVTGRGGKPVIEADHLGDGIALQGVSGCCENFGQGPGTGVQGISGTGVGVEAISDEGLALRVQGKAAFTTAGSATIPAGQNSVFVANVAVTQDSHISVTLTSDPGQRELLWVERSPGAGFTIHLSTAPPPMRPATAVSYLVIEPG